MLPVHGHNDQTEHHHALGGGQKLCAHMHPCIRSHPLQWQDKHDPRLITSFRSSRTSQRSSHRGQACTADARASAWARLSAGRFAIAARSFVSKSAITAYCLATQAWCTACTHSLQWRLRLARLEQGGGAMLETQQACKEARSSVPLPMPYGCSGVSDRVGRMARQL